ncbi:MAG: PAS domain S-box protein [Vulcanimicrobiota bacterium]
MEKISEIDQKSLDRLIESKTMLETILETTHMLVAFMDTNFNFIKVNRAYALSDGKDPGYYVGRNHFDLFPHEENKKIFSRVINEGKPHFASGKSFAYEKSPERGTSYWDWSLVPIKNEGGKVTSLVLTLQDVSKHIHTKFELEQSKTKYRNLIENLNEGIWALDENQKIKYVNQQLCNMLGYKREEIIGKKCSLFISHELNNNSEITPRIFIRKDGSKMYARVNSSKLVEEYNETGIIESITDITDNMNYENQLLELNNKLQKQNKKLLQVNKELDSFSHSVSHDLRAPLRAIDGFSMIIQEEFMDQMPQEANYYFEKIRTNTRRMSRLISDLLIFSRLGNKKIQPKTIEMPSLLNDILAEQKFLCDNRNIKFNLNSILNIQADPTLIRQVFVNLISNAVKFTKTRNPAVIEIDSWHENGRMIYRITDNGIGFNPLHTDKLFKVFSRLHSEKDYPGTGVGLALVYRIINKHDGAIWAQGELEKGASFYISLPEKYQKEEEAISSE